MVSRENKVIGVCILLAFVVGTAVYQLESAPEWMGFAAFIFVGVIVPISINEYLFRNEA